MTVQWIGEINRKEAPAGPVLAASGPFQAGPAWDESTQVWILAGGVPALVAAGPAVRAWRIETDRDAVRLLRARLP